MMSILLSLSTNIYSIEKSNDDDDDEKIKRLHKTQSGSCKKKEGEKKIIKIMQYSGKKFSFTFMSKKKKNIDNRRNDSLVKRKV